MTRQRLLGDVLQTSAILDEDLNVLSSLTDPNDYAGTGHRVPHVAGAPRRGRQRSPGLAPGRPRARAVALGGLRSCCERRVRPAVGDARRRGRRRALAGVRREIWVALNGMTVAEVLRQVLAGIEEEGLQSRLVRVRRSIDLGSIGWAAARLSGSGVSVGLQAKGTALIHRADLPPLANLELFSIAPRITPELYRELGPQRGSLRQGAGARHRCCCPSRASRSVPATTRASCSWSRSSAGSRTSAEPVELEATWPSLNYPLGDGARADVRSATGKAVAEITLDAAVSGGLDPERRRRSPPRRCASRPTSPSAAATRSSARTSAAPPSWSPFDDDELLRLLRDAPPGTLVRRASSTHSPTALAGARRAAVRRARSRGPRRPTSGAA